MRHSPRRAVAFQQACTRPRVEGVIEEIPYEPGRPVEQGTRLFRLESDTCEASLSAAQAEVESASAGVRSADTTYKRYRSLLGSGITEEESALRINIDPQKAESLGLSLTDINAMLSVVFGGRDANDFVLGSSLRPVIVQGATDYRMQPEHIDNRYARNDQGEMVPLPSFIATEWVPVSPKFSRLDGSSALEISGTQG